jgi:hypothetical protein
MNNKKKYIAPKIERLSHIDTPKKLDYMLERFILYGSTEQYKRDAIHNLPILKIRQVKGVNKNARSRSM